MGLYAKTMTKSMDTLVYRVQDEQGHGPYNGAGKPLYAMAKAHNRNGELRHRTPVPEEDDMGYHYGSEHYFGFESLGSLFEWFDGFSQSMHENGYTIGVYRVAEDDVVRGIRQLAFVKDRADFVQSLDLGCANPKRVDYRDAARDPDDERRAEEYRRQRKIISDGIKAAETRKLMEQASLYQTVVRTTQPGRPTTTEFITELATTGKALVPDSLLEDVWKSFKVTTEGSSAITTSVRKPWPWDAGYVKSETFMGVTVRNGYFDESLRMGRETGRKAKEVYQPEYVKVAMKGAESWKKQGVSSVYTTGMSARDFKRKLAKDYLGKVL